METKLTWVQYQFKNNYLFLMILFFVAGVLTPLVWGMSYILVTPVCIAISLLILFLGNKAYKIYSNGGTS